MTSARSLWARLVFAVDEARLGNRAVSALRGFRDLIVGLANDAKTDTVSIAIGKVLDRSGYLKDLRDQNTEEANERTENLMELVSAARDYESRDAEASRYWRATFAWAATSRRLRRSKTRGRCIPKPHTTLASLES